MMVHAVKVCGRGWHMRVWGVCACLVLAGIPGVASAVTVEFHDGALESLVRQYIAKPDGPIEDTDLVGVGFTYLYFDTEGSDAGRDLTGLEYCTDLEEVYITTWVPLEVPQPLGTLPKLRKLHLINEGSTYYQFPVLDIEWLQTLTNLQELRVSGWQFDGFASLGSLAMLETLDLGLGNVEDITPLSSLLNLRVLDLGANPVKSLEPLRNHPALDTFRLGDRYYWGGPVEDTSPLASISTLRRVSFELCPVSDISPLKDLSNLTLLSLRLCLVQDLSPILEFSSLDEDFYLKVEYNPLTEQSLCEVIPAVDAIIGQDGRLDWTGECGGAKPVITKDLEDACVVSGESFTFSAEVESLPNRTFVWWVNGIASRLPAGPEFTIESVSPEDEGWYSVMVDDANGTTISHKAYLRVIDPCPCGCRGGSASQEDALGALVIVALLGSLLAMRAPRQSRMRQEK